MPPRSSQVAHDFRPLFCVLKDGRIQRFDSPHVPPSNDPITGVQSKDVLISSQPKISARIYLPQTISNHQKLPLLLYFHGGGFSCESAFSILYHTYLNSLVAAAHVIAVSVEYRLAPENLIPACFEDCWTALKWVSLHARKTIHSPDPWINDHADFKRVFLMGDSTGATISHNISVRAGTETLGPGFKIVGMILMHPYFGDSKQNKFWSYICPGSNGPEHPLLSPTIADPSSFVRIWCDKVLICIASKDKYRERGWDYYEALKQRKWRGLIEIVETEGEKHVFHLLHPNSKNAKSLMKSVALFINKGILAYSSL